MHAENFEQLESQSEEVAMLNKLRAEVEEATPKLKAAMEKKAKVLYKTLSMSVHPDRLPKDCATAVRPVAEAVFDHAPKMEACIRKPLRCELPGLLTEAEIKRARAKEL